MTPEPRRRRPAVSPATLKAIRQAEAAWLEVRRSGLLDLQVPPAVLEAWSHWQGLGPVADAVPPLEMHRFFKGWPLIVDAFSQTEGFVGKMGEILATNLRGIVEAAEVLEVPRITPPVEDVRGLMDSLPNFRDLGQLPWEIERALNEADVGGDALDAAGYGFAEHLWNVFFLGAFAGVPEEVREAVVTNKLAAWTRSDAFTEDLRDTVCGSEMMRRRWPVIEAALGAHREKRYLLSVPALLPQVEGVIVDALFLKDKVIKEDNKFYLVDENGERRRNRKDKLLGPVTLSSALDEADLADDEDLVAASDFLAQVILQRRNDVLHGHDVSYGRAKVSVQALLVLLVLSLGVADLEAD